MANIRYDNDPVKREKYLAYFKGVYETNKEKRKAYQNQFYSIPENKVHYLIVQAKYRAKKENIPFDLKDEDVAIPTHCPYLGIELTYKHGAGRCDSNASLDKIIPELGYVKGNVQIISDKANRMKNDASLQELITFAKNILRKHDEMLLLPKGA